MKYLPAKQHTAIHNQDLGLVCPECQSKFAWASTLRRHRQKCHNLPLSKSAVKTFSCDLCSRGFKSRHHLKVSITTLLERNEQLIFFCLISSHLIMKGEKLPKFDFQFSMIKIRLITLKKIFLLVKLREYLS